MGQFEVRKKRWYDDGHDDGEVLGRFKTLNTIEEDYYSGKWLVLRDDGHLGILEQTEVSGMNNPKNGGSKFEFIDIGSIEDLQEYVNERFPGWFKLIDYLNEEFDEKFSDLDEENKEDNHFTYQMGLDEVHICSKKDGYVKWLLEKNYIDTDAMVSMIGKKVYFEWVSGELGTQEDNLCAYLAVSDNPLKDLASVLK